MSENHINFKSLFPVYHQITEEDFRYRFTVFTSAYNAEKTLKRTHDSLLKQTFSDFEWLVINDGSTDGTHKVMQQIQGGSKLNIHYVNNTQNRHKMYRFNQAIQLAQGELFLTFDADDECDADALEVFDREFNSVPEEMKDKLIAVSGLCRDEYGNQVGDRYPADPFYSDPFELYALKRIHGEKWGFTQTVKLKAINFNPKIFDHGYIPEGIIWNLLGLQGYKTKYINRVLRTYHTGVENSISDSPKFKTAVGSTLHYLGNINWHFGKYWHRTPVYFLKNLFYLLKFSNYSNFKLRSYRESVEPLVPRVIFICLWPFRRIFK